MGAPRALCGAVWTRHRSGLKAYEQCIGSLACSWFKRARESRSSACQAELRAVSSSGASVHVR